MTDTDQDPLLLRALRCEAVERTPIWLMRQAGRYMKEYRDVRKDVGFLELCHDPALSAKVTLDALHRLDVDAAILFSDILVPAEAMGAAVDFNERGPVIHNPVRTTDDVARVVIPDPDQALPFVAETVRRIREAMSPDKALIGFAGAPFTVASYMVEGGSTRDFVHSKTFLYNQPTAFRELLDKIAETTIRCLRAQVAAGAQAVQLFDSWAGFLSPRDYRDVALPPTTKVMDALNADGVPTILYANGGGALLESMAASGAKCISVDWRVDLNEAWQRVGHDRSIQGNLDPILLHGSPTLIQERARELLDAVGGRPGHVFNLGHGIQKKTPVDHVIALVEAVKNHHPQGDE